MKQGETASIESAVYIADSQDMREIPDSSIALIVTSPPYFNIKDYSLDGRQERSHSARSRGQIGDSVHFQDYLDALARVWDECERVLRPNGKLIVNAPLMPMLKAVYSTHENRHIFDLNAEIQHSILERTDEIFLMDTYVWNRTNPSKSLMFGSYPYPTNFYAQNTVEFISVYVKRGKTPTFPKDVRERSRLSKAEWVEMTKQVWNMPVPNKGDKAFGEHSALMPEVLAERCIRLYSMVGDVVLDPFAGSGTTLKVAKSLDRKFIGYEIVKGYENVLAAKVGVTPVHPKRGRRKIDTESSLPPERLLDCVQVSDFMDLAKKIPTRSIDLVCVDPPYNLGVADWDSFATDNQFISFTQNWLADAVRVLKPGGALWVFNTPRNAAHILVHLERRGMELRNWITWNKRDGMSTSKRRFVNAQETVLYLVKEGGEPFFDADGVRVPYESSERIEAAKKRGILKNGKRWFPNPRGKLCTDVWRDASDRHVNKVGGRVQVPVHPTIKPLSIMERIIKSSSAEGDVVLDYFCGSGSTLVAAKRLGRHFIGCDAVPANVELARERLTEAEWGSGLDVGSI